MNTDQLFIGMDLHQRTSTFVVKDKEGRLIDEQKIATEPKTITDFVQSFPHASIAVEPVSQWYYYADLLEDLGLDVHIAHPMRVKAIASARIKTDSIDAGVLCDLLRGNLLPESYHAPKEVRDWKELVRFHQSLVRLRVRIKNQIHSILWKNAIVPERVLWSGKGKKWLDSLALLEPYRTHLTRYCALHDELSEKISVAARDVETLVGEHKDAMLLTTIPGISYLSALTVMAEVGTIERFASPKKLMGYAGLGPSTYSSGGVTRHGKITKTGSSSLRWVLVEAAHHQLNCKKVPGFGAYYTRIKKRKGSSAAAVATARKLCAVMWRILKDKRAFVPTPAWNRVRSPV